MKIPNIFDFIAQGMEGDRQQVESKYRKWRKKKNNMAKKSRRNNR